MTDHMRRVVLESPYRGGFIARWLNKRYARKCGADCLRRGESFIASHLLLTQILDDRKQHDRALGITAGHAWIQKADALVVYTDRGITKGMKAGINIADMLGVPIEYRKLNDA